MIRYIISEVNYKEAFEMDWYNIMFQTHAGSWAFLILFFVLTYFFKKKALQMILRLFYVLMVVSGAVMLFGFGGYTGEYHLKATAAIILIGLMEMILVRRIKKGHSSKQVLPFWIGIIVLLTLVLLIAFNVISFG